MSPNQQPECCASAIGFVDREARPGQLICIGHLGTRSEPLPVLLRELACEEDWILDEAKQQSQIKALRIWDVINIDGDCLPDDCAE